MRAPPLHHGLLRAWAWAWAWVRANPVPADCSAPSRSWQNNVRLKRLPTHAQVEAFVAGLKSEAGALLATEAVAGAKQANGARPAAHAALLRALGSLRADGHDAAASDAGASGVGPVSRAHVDALARELRPMVSQAARLCQHVQQRLFEARCCGAADEAGVVQAALEWSKAEQRAGATVRRAHGPSPPHPTPTPFTVLSDGGWNDYFFKAAAPGSPAVSISRCVRHARRRKRGTCCAAPSAGSSAASRPWRGCTARGCSSRGPRWRGVRATCSRGRCC